MVISDLVTSVLPLCTYLDSSTYSQNAFYQLNFPEIVYSWVRKRNGWVAEVGKMTIHYLIPLHKHSIRHVSDIVYL